MLIFQRLRYWIWGGYCIPILLMLVSAAVVTVNVDRVRRQAEALNDSREIAESLADVAVDVQILSKTTRGYLIEQNPASLQSFNGAKENYREVISLVDRLVQDEQQDENLERLKQKVGALIEFDEALIQLVDGGQAEQALRRWQDGGAVALSEDVADLLAQVRIREQEIVDGRRTAQTQALDNLVWVVWGCIGVAIVVSIGLGARIITIIVQRITREATNITRATTEISATVEEQERVAVQQAASVNQTTTSMDELGASSTAATEQADAALTGAQRALSLSETGQQAVDSTLDGMETLQDKVEAIARQIVRLSEQTNQIGNISQLVADLANQTNMLALNAAVEAVRAGEHGRGFGVVATEIRKLADESQKSAQKIGTLVADIQTAINSTVMVTEEGTKTVRSGVDLAQKTAGAFSGVTEAVNEVVINNQQISLNIKQQALAISQVLEAMTALKQGAAETANGIGQTKNGMQQLKTIAAELQSII